MQALARAEGKMQGKFKLLHLYEEADFTKEKKKERKTKI